MQVEVLRTGYLRFKEYVENTTHCRKAMLQAYLDGPSSCPAPCFMAELVAGGTATDMEYCDVCMVSFTYIHRLTVTIDKNPTQT